MKKTVVKALLIKQTLSSKAGVPKLYLAMYPISISIDEHVPLKFLMTKWMRKITKICLPIF